MDQCAQQMKQWIHFSLVKDDKPVGKLRKTKGAANKEDEKEQDERVFYSSSERNLLHKLVLAELVAGCDRQGLSIFDALDSHAGQWIHMSKKKQRSILYGGRFSESDDHEPVIARKCHSHGRR